MFSQKSSIHVPRAARTRGGATPSLWQWMQIICRSENSPPDKVQSIHILNLHPRQVSPGCWLASPSLLLHVPTRERRRLFLQIFIYIYLFKKCQIIAPPAETSFNLLFWEHTREQIAFPDHLCCPCHALNYDATGAVRGESALWQNIKSTDWARGRHGFTNNVCAFHWALCASPFLTPLAVFDFHSSSPNLLCRGMRANKDFPSFSPLPIPSVTSQNLSLISAQSLVVL